MVTKNAKYQWGDTVKVSSYEGDQFPLHESGCVCGITEVSNQRLVDIYNQPVGTFIYTVEFHDGKDYGIPEKYLELVEG